MSSCRQFGGHDSKKYPDTVIKWTHINPFEFFEFQKRYELFVFGMNPSLLHHDERNHESWHSEKSPSISGHSLTLNIDGHPTRDNGVEGSSNNEENPSLKSTEFNWFQKLERFLHHWQPTGTIATWFHVEWPIFFPLMFRIPWIRFPIESYLDIIMRRGRTIVLRNGDIDFFLITCQISFERSWKMLALLAVITFCSMTIQRNCYMVEMLL